IWLPGLIPAVRHAPAAATMSIIYLGVLPGALAYVTWAYALSRVPASLLGTSLYLDRRRGDFVAMGVRSGSPKANGMVR
ncbi:MAG TPA: hypothetical protein VII48_14190, partial [Rhizomicrobium sp.]